jgi:N-acetylglucosaminyl-diphospho-decaprenol L-rhamnosyltransferase
VKLLVVILNYRITDLTIDCLRSLEPEMPSIPGARVAVCENGTGPDAEQQLRDAIANNGWATWVELTAIFPNLGFTGGNNVIIRKALRSADPPEYVLLLNADTLVKPGAVQTLVDFMDSHSQVGIAGSHLEWPDGSRQGSPFRFPGIASEFDQGLRLGVISRLLSRWSISMPISDAAFSVDWVSGASMIIRRAVLESSGLLDEGLYTYFDDVDFCLNARRNGWSTWYVPDSKVTHFDGASTGVTVRTVKRRPAYWFEARRRFFLKNYGGLYTALVDAAFLVGFSIWRLRRRILRLPDPDPPHMLIDSIRHSVLMTGFELRVVKNPALSESANLQ